MIGGSVWLMAFVTEVMAIAALWIMDRLSPRTAATRREMPSCRIDRIADRRRLSVLLVGLAGFLVSASFSSIRTPEPRILDEYCYLLAADTYSSGRLTNPTHDCWVHFENLFILQVPSYQAKYPPGQGLLLALGQMIGGAPIVGVWLGCALGCAATCWMLQAWLPPRWAILGGLLPVLRFGIFFSDRMAWGRGYWGGMVALVGGALLFGGLRRLVRRPTPIDALLMATGIGILSISRPFEGLVASVVALSCLALEFWRRRDRNWRIAWLRCLPGGLVVLSGFAAFQLYYNHRVTGNALRLPYAEEHAQYDPIPNFAFGAMAPAKTYRHAQIRNFYESPDAFDGLASHYEPIRGWGVGRWKYMLAKVAHAWTFFVGPVFTLPLVMSSRRLWRDRWSRFAMWAVVVGLAAFLVVNWRPIHYLAPFASLIVYLNLQALRNFQRSRRHQATPGRLDARALLVICFLSFGLAYAELLVWTAQTPVTRREAVTAQLLAEPGNHLVLVRFAPDQASGSQWLYNLADIDAQKIVWAREMGEGENGKLTRYFHDRQVWLLRADRVPETIEPYWLAR